MIALVGRSVQGDLRTGNSLCRRGGSRTVAAAGHGDGMLGRRRRCVLLEDGFDLHIAVRHGELVVHDCHAAADDLPLLEVIALVGRSVQGDRRTGRSFCMRGGSRSAALCGHGDGMLGRRGFGYRNRQLLRIAARAVSSLDGEGGGSFRSRRAADLAGVLVQAQTGRQTAVNAPCDRCCAGGGQGLAVCLAHLAVRQGVRGDGGCGGSVFADGEVVLRLAAVVPRAVQRHLGGLFAVKARVVRFEGVGMDVVGIAGGVVRVLRKLLRFVLARLMRKPRQLLFAAV